MQVGRFFIAAVIVVVTACVGSLALGAADAPAKPRNLIIVSIDTLRADRLGCYGNERPTSPAIDGIAAEGVIFDDASAPSPWTKPSHASLLTGLYPSRNGAVAMDSKMRGDVVHLASHLAGRGFQTLAVVNSMLLNQDGLERGFQQLKYVPFVQGDRKSSPVTAPAIEMLRKRDRDKPVFALVHYMDVHSDYLSLPKYEKIFVRPYDGFADGTTQQLYRFAAGQFNLDKPDAAHLLDLYDAGIRQIDDQLVRLFEFLGNDGLLDDSLLVVLSDHGEEFLEHGSVLHGHTQFQEIVRVPLIFRGPGVPAGKRVSVPVSLIDVMPTSLTQLGQPVPDGLDGVSVSGLWRQPAAEWTSRLMYFEADVVFPPPGPGVVPVGPYRAVRDDRFKLHLDIDTGNVALFDLSKDPGETVNVIANHPDAGKSLWVELKRFLGDGG